MIPFICPCYTPNVVVDNEFITQILYTPVTRATESTTKWNLVDVFRDVVVVGRKFFLHVQFNLLLNRLEWRVYLREQEGQHPLTGQRAANFSLLANQWAERRLYSDAMTSRLPRYEAKCVQRRRFQCGSVPLRSDIKGSELPPAIYWYHSKGNWLMPSHM